MGVSEKMERWEVIACHCPGLRPQRCTAGVQQVRPLSYLWCLLTGCSETQHSLFEEGEGFVCMAYSHLLSPGLITRWVTFLPNSRSGHPTSSIAAEMLSQCCNGQPASGWRKWQKYRWPDSGDIIAWAHREPSGLSGNGGPGKQARLRESNKVRKIIAYSRN